MTEKNNLLLESLQQKASDGDAQAQFELALCYAKGSGVERDLKLAHDWVIKAADQGNVNAQFSLGLSYFLTTSGYSEVEGEDECNNKFAYKLKLRRDLDRQMGCDSFSVAVHLFILHIENRYSDKFGESKYDDLAFVWFKKAAEQNNAEATYLLGQCYLFGIGAEKNDKLAFDCFTIAAERGVAGSLYTLALCFLQGKGIQQSDELAFQWFKKAAEFDDVDAQYWLAHCYLHGIGVEKSEDMALKLYVRAADQGHTNDWYEQAKLQGHSTMLYRFAVCYLYGKGVEKDYKTGMKLMVDAAAQGDDDANNWFVNSYLSLIIPSCLLAKGKGEQCYKYLFEWCVNDAKGYDVIVANLLLGILYYSGKGIKQSDDLAFEYFNKAISEWNNSNANYDSPSCGEFTDDFIKIFLSICYAQGKGVEKNLEKAEEVRSCFNEHNPGKFFIEGIIPNDNPDYTRHRKSLIQLRFKILIQSKEYDLAEDFINKAFNDPQGTETFYKSVCLNLIEQTKMKELSEKALHEKEKEMLSYFTHTMRNALATAPESLRQAIHLLGSDVYEKDTKHYQAINKIASLFSTLSLTDCLIDTFKQSISDPQEFRASWQMDHSGEATPKWVIASALRQSLNRIIFMSDTTQLRKLLNNKETSLVKATRKSFIEEVLPLNVDNEDINSFYQWLHKHITSVDLVLSETDNLKFGVNQTRFSLLFAIISELILNALKYWDGENSIQISWQLLEQKDYVFSVTNHCQKNATSILAGTHKGLAFIRRLIELLGEQADFNNEVKDQVFTAKLTLNKALFDEKL